MAGEGRRKRDGSRAWRDPPADEAHPVEMPRPLRIQAPGAIYHVYARGNRRDDIFRSDSDYALYLTLLERVCARFGWEVFAYCLMPNHVHLVLRTRHPNIAAGMQRLHGIYAQMFNARYALTGHLFQGRYGTRMVVSERHALTVGRYVVTNPVRAGLCLHAAEWRWSSYRATAGGARRPRFLNTRWLLSQLGGAAAAARAAYVAFVAGAARSPPRRE
jgi:putative transposase